MVFNSGFRYIAQRMKFTSHEIAFLRSGEATLRHIASGELMHSHVGPKTEATLLYAEQSRLEERLMATNTKEPLVLFDVGLGAGSNALAALQRERRLRSEHRACRPLQVISFENDLSGFSMALENHEKFPFFEGLTAAAQTVLERRYWQDGETSWTLHAGDFRQNLKLCPAPELIFFDFYSPKTAPELWDIAIFRELFEVCSKSKQPAALYTYSAATRVRAALLLAGFYVGYGVSTGAKSETTVASTTPAALTHPLDRRWLERFSRSQDRVPFGFSKNLENQLSELVSGHRQFQSL